MTEKPSLIYWMSPRRSLEGTVHTTSGRAGRPLVLSISSYSKEILIRAIIFDLDGTLVKSENLKALSYAIAIQQLRGLPDPEHKAIEAYREIVGAPREVASKHIVDKLNLEPDVRPLMAQYHVSRPSDVLASMRKSIYDEMVADPQVLRDNQWPHAIELVRLARQTLCKTGLATMSYREEVMHALRSLDLEKELGVVVTRDDVQSPKPDPEVYLTVCSKLDVSPGECIVLEDSVNGVKSALAAGTHVVGFATPFTSDSLYSSRVLDEKWIVSEPSNLLKVVARRIEEQNLGVP